MPPSSPSLPSAPLPSPQSDRLKVLVIDEDFPFPPDAGKRIRTWNLLRRLAARHDVELLCYGSPDSPALAPLENAGIKAHLVPPHRTDARGARFFLSLLLNLFSPHPFSVDKHYSRNFQDALNHLLASNSWDLLHCEWTPYMRFIHPGVKPPIVLATHNVEYRIWERRADCASNFLERLFFRLQARKMERFEKSVVPRAAVVTAVTPLDAKIFESWSVPHVPVVPNGADLDSLHLSPEKERPNEILSLSSLDWFPNLDSLDYFVREIFPLIRAVNPNTWLSVVGRRPPESLKARLSSIPGIKFFGEVPDPRPFLESAEVVVVPLRIGGGSRLKILEALAAGKAVVSTTIGAEGLDLAPGEDLLIADTPADFSRAVLDLLSDAPLRRRLQVNGRRTVVQKYDWGEIAGVLEGIWRKVATSGNAPPSRA